MKNQYLPVLSLVFVVALNPAATAAPDSLDLYDRFVVSSAMAAKCYQPEPAALAKFNHNFEVISLNAARRLQELRPAMPKKAVGELLKMRARQVGQAAEGQAAELGCAHSSVTLFIELFKAHAAWDVLGREPN